MQVFQDPSPLSLLQLVDRGGRQRGLDADNPDLEIFWPQGFAAGWRWRAYCRSGDPEVTEQPQLRQHRQLQFRNRAHRRQVQLSNHGVGRQQDWQN